MADSISYWSEELSREVSSFQALLEKLKALIASSNGQAIERAIRDCDVRSNRIKEVRKSFGLELKLIKNKEEKSKYEHQARDTDSNFSQLMDEFSQAKAQFAKQSLVGIGEKQPINLYSTEGKNNDTLLGEAHKIQDLTFESLSRTKNMIEASKEIGGATIAQLKEQHQQILEIENDVDVLDSNIVRAEKLVLNFSRRMATDRIIQMFAAVNFVIMLGLILYVAISGKSLTPPRSSSKSHSTSSVTAPNPTLFPTKAPSSFARHLRQ